MNLKTLKSTLVLPLFSLTEIVKNFPQENRGGIITQLNRWVAKKELIHLKRGLFVFPEAGLNEFVLANQLYRPSYISLESALNSFNIIPDIPLNTTSVSPTTSKKIEALKNSFIYSKINRRLYFGFTQIKDPNSPFYYTIALPEKALLDYIYLRRIKSLADLRLNLKELNKPRLKSFSQLFPAWVKRTIYE